MHLYLDRHGIEGRMLADAAGLIPGERFLLHLARHPVMLAIPRLPDRHQVSINRVRMPIPYPCEGDCQFQARAWKHQPHEQSAGSSLPDLSVYLPRPAGVPALLPTPILAPFRCDRKISNSGARLFNMTQIPARHCCHDCSRTHLHDALRASMPAWFFSTGTSYAIHLN